MRPTRTVVLLTAGLVTLFGVPAAAAADAPASLYVDNADAHCSDAGSGAQPAAFCTISAAARIVKPGQTVRIAPGETYDEAVTVDRSGEPGRPIAFVSGAADGYSRVDLGKSLTVSGAGHVVVRGMYIGDGIRVSRSADVELDQIQSRGAVSGSGLVVGEPPRATVRTASSPPTATRSVRSTARPPWTPPMRRLRAHCRATWRGSPPPTIRGSRTPARTVGTWIAAPTRPRTT
ncbi:hypothetical protein [Streptomyces sp. NPDC057686]|uniref:hypothetical protein n=1 Tax=Streptomyces sp. NPDC057686 TaxID=3346212 RepID=UPI0036A628BD